jgi:tetratricopeptide (TPR) repeat protein
MSTETPEYWKNKGDGFFKLNNYSEAIACYMRVIELDPENSEAWHCMGVSYENLGKYDEATKSYRRERRIHGDQIKQKHNPDTEKRINKHTGFSPFRIISIGLLLVFLSSFFIMALTYELLGNIDWVDTLVVGMLSAIIFLGRVYWKQK